MQIFYGQVVKRQQIFLDSDEAKHCSKVLRNQEGDTIYVIDGKGNMFVSQINSIKKEGIYADILHTEEAWGEHSFHITLCISPLRLKDRFEWIIEKGVELGANEIYLVQCERTISYPKLKPARLEHILITALKQAKRSQLPQLHTLQSFEEAHKQLSHTLALMGYCEADQHVHHYTEAIRQSMNITLWIGPEGDFTPDEVARALQTGTHIVSFGTNRLRSETAAIFALSSLKFIKGF